MPPDCVAVIEQVPAANVMMLSPETMQIDGVLLVSVTGRVELAVAPLANVTPVFLPVGCANVIVCVFDVDW